MIAKCCTFNKLYRILPFNINIHVYTNLSFTDWGQPAIMWQVYSSKWIMPGGIACLILHVPLQSASGRNLKLPRN